MKNTGWVLAVALSVGLTMILIAPQSVADEIGTKDDGMNKALAGKKVFLFFQDQGVAQSSGNCVYGI